MDGNDDGRSARLTGLRRLLRTHGGVGAAGQERHIAANVVHGVQKIGVARVVVGHVPDGEDVADPFRANRVELPVPVMSSLLLVCLPSCKDKPRLTAFLPQLKIGLLLLTTMVTLQVQHNYKSLVVLPISTCQFMEMMQQRLV